MHNYDMTSKNIEHKKWVVLGLTLQHAQDAWESRDVGIVDLSQYSVFAPEILKTFWKQQISHQGKYLQLSHSQYVGHIWYDKKVSA